MLKKSKKVTKSNFQKKLFGPNLVQIFPGRKFDPGRFFPYERSPTPVIFRRMGNDGKRQKMTGNDGKMTGNDEEMTEISDFFAMIFGK